MFLNSNADFSSKFADPQTKYHLLCAVLNDVERNGDKWLNCLEEERDFVAQRLQSLRAVTQQRMRTLCVGECVSLFDQVFLPVWLTEEDEEDDDDNDSEAENEGEEPHVKTEHPTRKAVRILNERLTFCEESLVENERCTLIVPVLEGVVVQFVKSLLFRRNISNPPPLNQKTGFFSGVFHNCAFSLDYDGLILTLVLLFFRDVSKSETSSFAAARARGFGIDGTLFAGHQLDQ